ALLGTRREMPDGQIRFERVIDPDRDWRVAEHVVAGQPVLPGTAYVELARAAGLAVFGQRPFEILALSLALPMIFAAGLPRRVAVALQPVAQGYELRVESIAAPGQEPVEHARVQLKALGQPDARLPASLAARPALRPSPRSGHAPQETLIDFGPRWKNVGALATGDDAAEGHFALPAAFAGDLATHPLHPALLDMAATVGLNALADGGAEGMVYVPMSAERIRVFAPLPAKVTARARRVAGEPRKFAAFDVVI